MKYIFGSGTARGGTGILVQTLSAHTKVEYSLDPVLGVFRSFRNAVIKNISIPNIAAEFNYSSAISDYYFSDTQNAILNAILNGDLDYAISTEERLTLVESMKSRTALDNPDLVEYMTDNLKGDTYGELLESVIELIAKLRGSSNTEYCGLHENWTIEMFPSLARKFPDAKFIVVLRDPRAVQASHLAVEENLRTSLLTYARGIRKLMNLSMYYLEHELFKDRLVVVTYEELLRNPESVSEQLCSFLNLPYEPDMINPDKHIFPGTNELRDGVSSFEKQATGYNPSRIDRWKKYLTGGELDMTEMALDPDMRFFGYMPLTERVKSMDTGLALMSLHKDNQKEFLWRTDTGHSEKEFGYELSRNKIISRKIIFDNEDILNRCFLNKDIYKKIISPPEYDETIIANGGIWFA